MVVAVTVNSVAIELVIVPRRKVVVVSGFSGGRRGAVDRGGRGSNRNRTVVGQGQVHFLSQERPYQG